jgi:hypothetical protein
MARPTFRIEELRIRNFRGIDELDLKLDVPDDEDRAALAVIAGDNGCGKTAVLEAILLVLGRQDLLPGDAAPLAEQVRFGTGDFEIAATLRPLHAAVPTTLRTNLAISSSPTSGIWGGEGIDDGKRVPHGPFWEAIDALKPNVEYFSARREPEAMGQTTGPLSRGDRSAREARRIAELKRRIVNTYYRSLEATQSGAAPGDSPFARLQRFVQHFLGKDHILGVLPVSGDPGADFEVVVRTGPIPLDVTSLAMARAMAVEREDIPTLIPLDRLSSGQVAIFAFAAPLLFRDAPADVVLIDEPEQHLHVQWQGALVRALRELSPKSQIIVATHSLDILDVTSSYERHLLLRSDDPRALDAAE